MATSPLGPGDISLRDSIEAVGSAETAHGTVSTAAVAGGLGSSLLLMDGTSTPCGSGRSRSTRPAIASQRSDRDHIGAATQERQNR